MISIRMVAAAATLLGVSAFAADHCVDTITLVSHDRPPLPPGDQWDTPPGAEEGNPTQMEQDPGHSDFHDNMGPAQVVPGPPVGAAVKANNIGDGRLASMDGTWQVESDGELELYIRWTSKHWVPRHVRPITVDGEVELIVIPGHWHKTYHTSPVESYAPGPC